MTALTYQKDARAYRFSLPNEIWGLKLPPLAFSILAYLCYLNRHHKGDAVPSVGKIAELLHMSPDMAQKQIYALVKRDLISPQMVPVFSRKHTGKFFSLPNEIFFLDLGHGAITVYAYLLYCEDRSSHQCHPSYKTISSTVGLAVNTVMKHIAKLVDRQFITVEHTSYFDRQGMKKNGNNCYTILPIQAAVNRFHNQQLARLETEADQQRVTKLLREREQPPNAPCFPL
nr:helix-turn-helix domain-containing protein [uncultured Oscillibacter sp.]